MMNRHQSEVGDELEQVFVRLNNMQIKLLPNFQRFFSPFIRRIQWQSPARAMPRRNA